MLSTFHALLWSAASAMGVRMSHFAFIHPWLLLLFIPIAWFIHWMSGRQNDSRKWAKLIDKRFLPYLLIQSRQGRAMYPPFYLIAAVMLLLALVLAGPSFTHKKSPFKNDHAKVAFVIKNTPSMMAADIQPNRLQRAIFKLTDLLKLRPKLQSSLIAYSGSANLALPLTRDSTIVLSFAQVLEPGVMPVIGDDLANAVALAADSLKGAGSVVVFADAISKKQIDLIKKNNLLKDSKIIFVAMMPNPVVDHDKYRYAGRQLNADLIYFSKKNDDDVQKLSAEISHNFKNIEAKNAPRNNDGYYLLYLVALIMLLWFRKGFLAEAWRVS